GELLQVEMLLDEGLLPHQVARVWLTEGGDLRDLLAGDGPLPGFDVGEGAILRAERVQAYLLCRQLFLGELAVIYCGHGLSPMLPLEQCGRVGLDLLPD